MFVGKLHCKGRKEQLIFLKLDYELIAKVLSH